MLRTRCTCAFDPLSHQSPHEAGTVFTPVRPPKGMDLQQRGRQWQILTMKCNDKTVREQRGAAAIYTTETPSPSLADQETCRCCHLKWGRGGGLSVCGGGLLFKQTLKLTILRWVQQGRLCYHGTVGFDTSPEWRCTLSGTFFCGNSRRPPCSCRKGSPMLHQVTTAQPIREASGNKSKLQLSLFPLH